MGFFSIHSAAKHRKIEGGNIFIFEKNLTMPKKLKEGTLFSIHSVAKQQKNWRGTLWEKIFPKKVSQCRKKMKGGPFGLARYGMLRGKTGKTFWVQFARSIGAIWCNNIL